MTRKRAERGSALPLAIWIMAVLFVIAISFSLLLQGRVHRIDLLFRRFQAYTEAYSTLQYGIHMIMVGQTRAVDIRLPETQPSVEGPRFFLDGSPAPSPLFPEKSKLAIQACSGLIDMRMIHPELLDGLLLYFGADVDVRRVFVDSLMDWIDQDDFVRLNGAEKDYYERLGYRPRNAPLATIDEIALIRGMEPSLLRKIRPFLTFGKSMEINPNTAPYEVLMSFPNMTDKGAKNIMSFRKDTPLSSVQMMTSVSGVNLSAYEPWFDFGPGISFLIKASSDLGDGHHYVLYCVISKISGDPSLIGDIAVEVKLNPVEQWTPYIIEYWREGIE
jgi:type II secretory pathway component PulK